MKNALLILNPVSGKLKAKTAIYSIIEKLNERDVYPTVVFTRHRGHAAEVAAAAKSQGYDCVICVGGDGTLNETIKGLIDSGSDLPVGYIPAGSTNDFASGLGLPLDLTAAAASLADALNSGSTVDIDIGMFIETAKEHGSDTVFSASEAASGVSETVNNEKTGNITSVAKNERAGGVSVSRTFTYIASFGAFTQSSYNTPQAAKNLLGHLAYVLQGTVDFFSIKPIHVKMKAGEQLIEGDYVFGGVCNTYSVGGIVKLSRDNVDIGDGEFEVILVKYPYDLNEFNQIVNACLTSKLTSDMFVVLKASEVEFELPTDISWSLDGEEAKGGNIVRVTNLKRAAHLLMKE